MPLGDLCSKDHSESSDVHPATNFVDVTGLRHQYAKADDPALQDISFEVRKGEVVVIIGPNGAGKSTLINILAGGFEPTSGSVNKPQGISVGIVLQENVVTDVLTVREHIQLFSKMRGLSETSERESLELFADQLQLSQMLDTRACDLSGGQKRKLCVALAMLGEPDLVLMDEPTVGVDIQARQLIWKLIAGLKSTAIITTHALEEAETVSSRLFILSGGSIPYSGTSTELRRSFNCGYLLRLEGGDRDQVLALAQSVVPESRASDERSDSLLIPINEAVPDFLRFLDDKLEELGVTTYTFSIEVLDNVLLRMNHNGEDE
jgi:ABC-type multidrug transport system ATPase subunit